MSNSSCCGSPSSSASSAPAQEDSPANLETAVLDRYKSGAQAFEPSLCCAVDYDPKILENLPPEIIEKDYGCGDPTRYIQAGETVVDLGSGAGKNCYIMAQTVGSTGSVIGIDFNDEMLNLARQYRGEMAEKLGYENVQFLKAKIQDLALDLDRIADYLQTNPIGTLEQWWKFEVLCQQMRQEKPLIASDSIDVVVSNCVLNLVRPADKQQLFEEIYRVLKPGGRAVISDIVSDRSPTPTMMADPELWSGCISGAFLESQFPEHFQAVGFQSVEILERQAEPWQVIEGIEFRSLTVRAYK